MSKLNMNIILYFFEKSSNVDLKRLLLKFVFENITLTEGVISYKLRFPFNEFANINTPKGNKVLPHEPLQTLAEQGVQANDNEKVQIGYKNFCEPQFIEKKQGVVSENTTPLQIGWGGWIRTNECRHQKPMPYHLATPQQKVSKKQSSKRCSLTFRYSCMLYFL